MALSVALLTQRPAALQGADNTLPRELQQKSEASLDRGIRWLRGFKPNIGTAQASLTNYTLLKTGMPKDAPVIVQHRDAVLKKIADGFYAGEGKSPTHFVYEGGVDAMFLEACDSREYVQQLTEIRDFLVRNQLGSGGWYYVSPPPDPTGDTSITQYAVLGLWAIERADIEVPREVWAKVARFLDSTQKSDGGFAYHPFDSLQTANITSTASMTAAGLGTTLVAQRMLYGAAAAPAPVPSRRRFGVLEQLGEGKETAPAKRPMGDPGITRDAFKKVISGAERALSRLFESGLQGPNGGDAPHPVYFLYGCERAGALVGSEILGDVPWFERGVEFLVRRQKPDGSWDISNTYTADVDTAFALLFLSRATRSLVPQAKPARKMGGGLLAGGRGLPDDLSSIQVEDGKLAARVPKGDIDKLLSELEQPNEANVPSLQQGVVELVQLDRPEELIGNIDRLRTLLQNPAAEIRQVAAWALARSGDLQEIPRLIALLDDPDLVVAWEASLGLCVLSRMPAGIIPANATEPLPVQPPGIQEEGNTPASAVDWRKKTRAAWDAWYQEVRPYEERDDQRQIRTR